MKGKENHHLQVERSQSHFNLKGKKKKKVSGFEAQFSVANNQGTVGPFKKKLIFHVKPKPDRSINP